MRDKDVVKKNLHHYCAKRKTHCAFWDTTTHVGLVDQTVSVVH